MLSRAARFIAGFVVATLLWLWISPLLARGMAATTEPLLQLDARFRDAQLSASESMVSVDAPHGTFPQTKYPADQLTFNLILLVALFASNRRPWRDRNIIAFLISLAIAGTIGKVLGVWIVLWVIVVLGLAAAFFAAPTSAFRPACSCAPPTSPRSIRR